MNMKRKKIALLAALILALTAVLPMSAALADRKGTVKGGWLVLRNAPSFNGTILASYPSGTVVTITETVGSWYAVITPDNMAGYMLGDYLQVSGSSGGNTVQGDTAYVTSRNGLNVRLRSGPGKGYSILASYAPGTKCTVLSAGNNWCRVQIGGYTGYMMTEFLTSNSGGYTVQPQPVPDGTTVYVTSRNGNGVNLRSGPDKSYSSIGFYSVGTAATMITRGSTWSYIQIGNRIGYMMTQFLTTNQPAPPAPPLSGAYVVSANGKNVNLRTGPSTGSPVITSFKVGTRLTIITRGSDWCFVQIGEYYGYMMRQFIYEGTYNELEPYSPTRNDYEDRTPSKPDTNATITDLYELLKQQEGHY